MGPSVEPLLLNALYPDLEAFILENFEQNDLFFIEKIGCLTPWRVLKTEDGKYSRICSLSGRVNAPGRRIRDFFLNCTLQKYHSQHFRKSSLIITYTLSYSTYKQ